MRKPTLKLATWILTVSGVMLTQTVCATASAQSIFPDKNLEAAVRKEVFEKRNNDQPILETDVPNISQVVGKGREGKKVASLAGLEKCRSIAAVELDLNDITDLTPLRELKNVQLLSLKGNKVKDLSPLAGLTNLQYLQLENNEVEDLAPLAGLSPSKFLFLQGNQIADLTVLVEMAKKDAAGEKRFAPFWYVDVSGNPLSDAAKSAQLGELRKLGVADRIIFK